MKIKDIARLLDEWAPFGLQLDYDNSGIQIGEPDREVHSALVALEVTDDVINEAISGNHDLIITHHPLIYTPIKRLNGSNHVQRVVARLIKENIGLICFHTNLDSVRSGVSGRICENLNLQNTRILSPVENQLYQLIIFCPQEWEARLLKALWQAGAGHIGEYKECAGVVPSTGHFTPSAAANPHIGKSGNHETVSESRIEVLYRAGQLPELLAAARALNYYEEVAYYSIPLKNTHHDVGLGMVGDLPAAMSTTEFLGYLSKRMDAPVIRHTSFTDKSRQIKRVAVCGGSGSELLEVARRTGADVFVTADFKYHRFFDADGDILIADIGHYESEQFTSELITEYIRKKISNFAVLISKVNTNPISYFIDGNQH